KSNNPPKNPSSPNIMFPPDNHFLFFGFFIDEIAVKILTLKIILWQNMIIAVTVNIKVFP
ncbi:MAG: hypothetical protein ACI4I3_05595, partial [Acutalibacteraceae bacterium]